MALVCALHRVGCPDGFVFYFVDLAVHFAVDRVMAVLVAFVPAMRRIDGVNRAGRAVLDLVRFLIDVTRELRDLDTASLLADILVRLRRWHRRTRRDCKSAKRNRQRRPNENLSSCSLHNAASLASPKEIAISVPPSEYQGYWGVRRGSGKRKNVRSETI